LRHAVNAACIEMWIAAMAFGIALVLAMRAIESLLAHGPMCISRNSI
jgi:hypothetical protein